jgi:hypothetical protein
MKPSKYTPTVVRNIKRWVNEGIDYGEIAKRLDITLESFRVVCSRRKIKLNRKNNTIITEVQNVSEFNSEVIEFVSNFTERFNTWHKTEPTISDDGKTTLMGAFYLCSDSFTQLAQKLDGR